MVCEPVGLTGARSWTMFIIITPGGHMVKGRELIFQHSWNVITVTWSVTVSSSRPVCHKAYFTEGERKMLRQFCSSACNPHRSVTLANLRDPRKGSGHN